jgi:hypothetical protein
VELKSAVIGLGETGGPLFEILQEHYGNDVEGYDIKTTPLIKILPHDIEVLNITIPYSDKFLDIINVYQDLFNPSLVIVHSTVPIGTTRQIPNAVHSPILGRHDRMKEDLKTFKKWIGGEKVEEARNYLQRAGFYCECVSTSEETEALKLMCLAKYGMSIAFAQYCKDIADIYKFPYDDVARWDVNYNVGVDEWLQRPILQPPNGPIKGHCVIPNTKILNQQHPNPILQEVLKYE